MSLITIVNTFSGIIVSADSRTTGVVAMKKENGDESVHTHIVLSDFTQKLFILNERFAVGCFGDAVVGGIPMDVHFKLFEESSVKNKTISTQDFTASILEYFRAFIPRPAVGIIVAGYDKNESHIFSIDVKNESFERKNYDKEKKSCIHGLVSCGDTDVVDRLLTMSHYLPKFEMMNNTDAAEYSRYLIDLSAKHMQYEIRPRTIGGPIDTVLLLPNGNTQFIIKKSGFE